MIQIKKEKKKSPMMKNYVKLATLNSIDKMYQRCTNTGRTRQFHSITARAIEAKDKADVCIQHLQNVTM